MLEICCTTVLEGLGLLRSSEAVQHLEVLTVLEGIGRPITDLGHAVEMLQSRPALRPFAA